MAEPSDLAVAVAAPRLTVLLPEGWARLHLDDRANGEVQRIVSDAMKSVPLENRDLARVRLRGMLKDLVVRSQKSHLYEAWIPVGPTNGLHIPASIVVGPVPQQPSRGTPAHEVLLSMSAASAGSRAVTVGGVIAVRIVADRVARRDETGELTAPAARIVSFIVSPPADELPWITFTASLFVPDGDDSAEIVEALEFLVDALVATVEFEKAGVTA